MQNELNRLVQYCKDNGITVIFTDSKVLKDYAAMNPEAAKSMGFPDIDNKIETKEILIDKNVPEVEQVKNLKHELIEMKLMQEGLQYWDAHTIALRDEDRPFDYTQSVSVSTIPVYQQPITPIVPSVPSRIVKKKKKRSTSRASGYKLDFEGMKDF